MTTKAEGSEDILILKMSDPEVHTCSAEKTGPLMQKFRVKLARRMAENLDIGWSKIWNEERSLLLGTILGSTNK